MVNQVVQEVEKGLGGEGAVSGIPEQPVDTRPTRVSRASFTGWIWEEICLVEG